MATTATYKYLDYEGLKKFAQIINDKLQAIAGGEAASVDWENVKNKPTNFTPAAHKHSGADITSGTVGFDYLPTGTGAQQVAIGNHTHADLATAQSVTTLSNSTTTALNLKAPLDSPKLTGTPTAPTANAGTNNTQIATTAFVGTAVSNAIAGVADALIYKGTVSQNGGLPAKHEKGWTYKVAAAGTYVGKTCEVGDMIICNTDGTSANNSHWDVIQTNIDGAVTGPSSSVDNRVAVFNGATGKVIKDSGFTIATSVPANALFSDTTYTFANGTNGSFTVTPKGGSAQTVSIGKPLTAGTADNATQLNGKEASFYATADSVTQLTNVINNLDNVITATGTDNTGVHFLISVTQENGLLKAGTCATMSSIVATDITWDKLLA